MAGDDDAIPASDRPPGYDEEDPYAGEDLGTYPEWWRENVELFRAHEMRPYRPPRFADGAYSVPVVREVERTHGVDVTLRSNPTGPATGERAWAVWVDGERVETLDHRRDGAGYSVYGVTEDEFRALVADAVE